MLGQAWPDIVRISEQLYIIANAMTDNICVITVCTYIIMCSRTEEKYNNTLHNAQLVSIH